MFGLHYNAVAKSKLTFMDIRTKLTFNKEKQKDIGVNEKLKLQ